MMKLTPEQKAQAYRELADAMEWKALKPNGNVEQWLRQEADKLDPKIDPKVEPGTVVWWRMDGGEWQIGIVSAHMQIIDSELDAYEFDEVRWKPARILGPRQIAVDVPPVDVEGQNTDRLLIEIMSRASELSRRYQGTPYMYEVNKIWRIVDELRGSLSFGVSNREERDER
jgi:hypothetical protein